MKTIGIRYWLLLLWLALVVFGNAIFMVSIGLQTRLAGEGRHQDLGTLRTEVIEAAPRWGDPSWREDLDATLRSGGGAVIIEDASGRVRYSGSGGETSSRGVPDEEILLSDGSRRLGTAALFAPPDPRISWIPYQVAPSLLILLLLNVSAGWFLARTVLRPMRAMSDAARRIAAGDLDFDLPPSRVREVAEVSAAFGAMGEGLRESVERQAKLEEERRLFVSAIAHDLRTPLFALRGYLGGIEQGIADTPEKAASYLAVCREKADVLEKLVADLFAYARLEYPEWTPRREPVELGALLESSARGLEAQARAGGVTLRLEAPGEPCVLKGDGQLLGRVAENLLTNALGHTPRGGEIRLSWYGEPDRVVFSVADDGPGIPPEDLPHLFAPLYRGEASRNRKTGGTGLGLTIARRIVLTHGGTLTAANLEDGGAVFTVVLPTSSAQDGVPPAAGGEANGSAPPTRDGRSGTSRAGSHHRPA